MVLWEMMQVRRSLEQINKLDGKGHHFYMKETHETKCNINQLEICRVLL